MQEKMGVNSHRYFAAANTYWGFVSYFDKIFSPYDYERIYVLKGGPGTGKSSLMKGIMAKFIDKECTIEEIYCSSDPHSLDGIIISYNGKKIAILDGTAPHERDTKIPGAIDEIINLGEGWNSLWLKAKKNEILSLNKEKSSCYSAAYSYLKIAGKSADFIKSIYAGCFDKTEAKNKAECILQDIPTNDSGMISTRLISSFGRYGEYRLNTLSELKIRTLSISGSRLSKATFLEICLDALKKKNANMVHLLYALDPSMTDAIYLPDHSLAIVGGDEENSTINADEFFDISPVDLERIKVVKQIKTEALAEAQRWFGVASDFHFRLEEIYSQAMNFEKNNQIIEQKITEIADILEITI